MIKRLVKITIWAYSLVPNKRGDGGGGAFINFGNFDGVTSFLKIGNVCVM